MPGSNSPTTSPANASSTSSRPWPMSSVECASRTGLPVRASTASAPRSKRPEQMRRNATRSRWSGSMFAWILKTKPEKSARAGSIGPAAGLARAGAGASSRKRSRNGSTPKFVSALPKNIGVCRPARDLGRLERRARAVEQRERVARALRPRAGRRPRAARAVCVPCFPPDEVERAVRRAGRRRRGTRCPRRSASASGTTSIPSTSSTSPIRSSGSRPGRSILFTNVKIGMWRRRQTSKSLRVCASTPFARVDQHHRAVGRDERAVGVLAEVAVARACRGCSRCSPRDRTA